MERPTLADLKPLMTGDAKSNVIAAVNHLRLTGRFVEVGTFQGGFAERVLRCTACETLFCVDPYRSYEDFDDGINKLDLEKIFRNTQARLRPYRQRMQFIREFSEDGAKRFDDGSLDFVYIDANHRYEYVMRDLEAWYPKTRSGGLFCGDDAHDKDDSKRDARGDVMIVWQADEEGNPKNYGSYGVFAAIRDFAKRENLDYFVSGGQFLAIKP